MNISFYTFSKKTNSTKKPLGIAETIYNCNFLESTDVIHPSIALVVSAKPTAFNYAYIEDLRRYYFIDSWDFVGGRWVARMSVDALASWKTEIGESTLYVERSSYTYDSNLIDYQYKTEANPIIDYTEYLVPWYPLMDRGSYVLGVRSEGSGIGSTTYYVLTIADMLTLCNMLFSNTDYLNITDISADLQKALFDPMQYIVSCVWIPIDIPNNKKSASAGPLKFGWWTFSSGTYVDPSDGETKTHTISVKKLRQPFFNNFWVEGIARTGLKFDFTTHILASDRGNYLNFAPYSSYHINIPRFGDIDIDPIYAVNKSVVADFHYDLTSGECVCELWSYYDGERKEFIKTVSARVGSDVSISSNMANIGAVSSAYGGVISAVGGTVSAFSTPSLNIGGAVGKAISNVGGLVSAVGNALDTPVQRSQSSMSNGSFAWMGIQWASAHSIHYTPVPEDNNHFGRPLCNSRQLKTIPGFIKCSDADISIPCLSEEKSMIIGDLLGGFFYE